MAEVDEYLSEPHLAAVECLSQFEGDVMVLGAGGKMGLHLCLMLRKAREKAGASGSVTAVSRFGGLRDREVFERSKIRTVAGDLRDPDFVKGLPRAPLVFYLVGAKFGTTDNPKLLEETNVELAERLSWRFRESRIVAFSTGCVYSFVTPESGGSKEDSKMCPVGEYAQSCIAREQCFRGVSEAYATPLVLIRLNYSVEFRYGVLVDIARSVIREEPIDVTTGWVNVIWQNDALNHVLQSVALASSPAVPVNIAGLPIVSVRDLARRFGELFGKEPRCTGQEADTAWLSNPGNAHSLFGKPKVPLEKMIQWTAAWVGKGGATFDKPTGFQCRDGKF